MSAEGPGLVVLAAGASTRLGQSKALARLHDGPGGTALELLLAAGARLGDPRPLVVAGRDTPALSVLLGKGVELFENDAWAEGRTGSVLRAVERRLGRDLCLAPVDAPLVPAEVFAALASEWTRLGRPARGWLAPRVAESLRRDGSPLELAPRHGHPVLVGRELLAELKEFPADRPLTELRRRATPLLSLAVESPAILDNLDAPEDLERLRRRLAAPLPATPGQDSP